MMYVGQNSILSGATLLAQAKNYPGTGKWFDEIGGTGYLQPGSVLGAYIGPTSYGAGNALILPGVNGNYATRADASAMDITGDITFVARAKATDWTPSSNQAIIGKWTSTGNQRSYAFQILSTGEISMGGSTDGASSYTATITTATGFTDNTTHWVALSLDVNDGAGNRVAKVWTSDTDTNDPDAATWTQLGSTLTTAGTTSIYSSTAPVITGSLDTAGSNKLVGEVYRTQVYSGVRDFSGTPTGGTLVYDANFVQATGTTSFNESSSNAATVTVVSTSADTNDPQWLPHSTSQNPFGAGVDYTYFPGIAANYVSTPDTAALDITGDITLVGCIAPTDWTPSAINGIVSKAFVSGQYSYFMYLNTDGTIRLSWFSDGTGSTQVTITSTVATGFTDRTARWVAASLDADNGSSQNVVKFWTSSDGATWSQLGSTVTTAGVASIFSGTSQLEVGAYVGGTGILFNGSIARAQVYSGVRDFSGTPSGGTLVADFNPDGGTINSTATSLTGTGDGLTWTINRAATGRKTTWVERDRFLFGTDDRFSLAGLTPSWIGTEAPYTVLIAFRFFGTTIGGGKILLGNGRAGVALNSGASVATTFSNQFRMHISDGVSSIASNNIAVSSFNGTQSGFGGTYDPSAESIRLQYTANAGTSLTASLSSGLTDLGAVAGGTNYLGWQSTDNTYMDMEVVGIAVFSRVLTDAEAQQAYQELYT